MRQLVESFSELGQGQVVRIALDDGRAVEARVNQISYAPDDELRVELTGEDGRCQIRARAEGGSWAPVELRRYDRREGSWIPLAAVEGVTAGGTFRTVKSEDMEAQEATGPEQQTRR